ncbi:dihydrodipicolinate synthase [Aulographum hederae CBS 113979]|uniref:Dihydrodipicolinate synthase n=1 Tax=Aulographum hederae CBS 113979 TaxID=1176131 RepID=A0A6G1GL13_9PEZI|nr:dihydrodipicolinate synthase [Aulographum hederae CBS 113979]
MSPHNDAPSPPGSYTPSYNHLTSRSPAVQSPLYSMAQFNDSGFDTSSIESTDVGISRPLMPGVYVPTVVFFDPVTEDLDHETIAAHAVRLAKAGVAGITTQGSNGEAVHLSHKERNLVTKTTRKALDDAGYSDMPIIVGTGTQSTRETVELCYEAQEAGGDYALILPPSYYQGLFTADTVKTFFRDVADASPIPVLIYNYPGAVSGLDLNSDAIIELSKHQNIVGCKLTCGNTGKLNRIASATRAATPSEPGSGFMCMGGSADFTLQTMMGGGSGIIGGLANVTPRACVKLVQLFEEGKLKDATKLQAIVARGDWAAIQGGLVGTKSAMMSHFGYGGYARKPLPRPGKEENRRWREAFEELVSLEKTLTV